MPDYFNTSHQQLVHNRLGYSLDKCIGLLMGRTNNWLSPFGQLSGQKYWATYGSYQQPVYHRLGYSPDKCIGLLMDHTNNWFINVWATLRPKVLGYLWLIPTTGLSPFGQLSGQKYWATYGSDQQLVYHRLGNSPAKCIGLLSRATYGSY